jgi:hypothetical protein
LECCVSECFREIRVRFAKCIASFVKRFVVQRSDTFLFFMIHVWSVHHLCHIRSSRASQETEESLHSIFLHLILPSSFSIHCVHCVHIFSCALISSRTGSPVLFSIAPLVCINLFRETVVQCRILRIFKRELGGQYCS